MQRIQETQPFGGDHDRRVIAPAYLAVIQRSVFRDEGSLFDALRARPAAASPQLYPPQKKCRRAPGKTGTTLLHELRRAPPN
jgi:hypothetical protein